MACAGRQPIAFETAMTAIVRPARSRRLRRTRRPELRHLAAATLVAHLMTARSSTGQTLPTTAASGQATAPVASPSQPAPKALELRLSMSPAAARFLSEPAVRGLVEIELEEGVLA